jgi:dUTP pyrophosphatase
MAHFEKVSKYADVDLVMPSRATEYSAGYDLYVAEDTIIPPMEEHIHAMKTASGSPIGRVFTLDQMKDMTKILGAKPTLVSTGVKCKLENRTYLKVVPRSSTPLKHWLVVANSEGIIDADYYGCEQNEGEIYVQLLNLSPFPIKLQKGECVAQGIICPYGLTEDDNPGGKRVGGYGSTTK